jgi:IS5 family transposase
LYEQINMGHPLVRLAGLMDWELIERHFSAHVTSGRGRPALPPRLVAGLLYLQHANDASDEAVVNTWLENPYWQFFTGETYLQTQLPIDPSSLTRWRQRIGEEGVEVLLAATIQAARAAGLIKRASVNHIIVDTTVMPKAIAHPTGSRLMERARQHLVRFAQKHELELRQNYNREAPRLAAQVGRYAHAKQYKRMQATLKLLRTRVGRVQRDVERKLGQLSEPVQAQAKELLHRAHRILTQKTKDKNKLYAMHAPEVECISKVRREVAHIIVSPAHEVGDETGRSVDRSLLVHALLVTAACEATGTTYRAFGPRRLPRGSGVTCQHQGGWDARLSGMVNRSELLQASLCTTSQRC